MENENIKSYVLKMQRNNEIISKEIKEFIFTANTQSMINIKQNNEIKKPKNALVSGILKDINKTLIVNTDVMTRSGEDASRFHKGTLSALNNINKSNKSLTDDITNNMSNQKSILSGISFDIVSGVNKSIKGVVGGIVKPISILGDVIKDTNNKIKLSISTAQDKLKSAAVLPFKTLSDFITKPLKSILDNQKKSNKPKTDQVDDEFFADKKRKEDAILGDRSTHDTNGKILRYIRDDTQTIIELLQDGIGTKKGDSGFDWKMLLPFLPALLGGLLGAIAPEIANAIKTAVTAAKSGSGLLTSGGKLLAQATKAIKGGSSDETKRPTDVDEPTTTQPRAKKPVLKDLFVGEEKIGKLGTLSAGLGIGATYGRYAQGDTTGAVVQGVSTALPLVLSKTPLGKAANIVSALMDGGLFLRDRSNKNEEKVNTPDNKDDSKDGVVESSNQSTTQDPKVDNESETNKLLSNIDYNITSLVSFLVGGSANPKVNPSNLQLQNTQIQKSESGMSGAGLLAAGGVGALGLIVAKRFGAIPSIAKNVISEAGEGASKVAPKIFTPATNVVKAPFIQKAANVAAPVLKSGGVKLAGKVAGKVAGKLIPGVGLAMGAVDAYDRAKKGDYVGAALSGAAGVTSLIPGIGTGASLAIMGGQAVYDNYNSSDDPSNATNAIGAGMVGTGIALATRNRIKASGVKSALSSASNISRTVKNGVDETTKTIKDATVNSAKTVTDSVKSATGAIDKTGAMLTNVGTSLKTNIEKMYANVNGNLLKSIGILGTVSGGLVLATNLVNSKLANPLANTNNKALQISSTGDFSKLAQNHTYDAQMKNAYDKNNIPTHVRNVLKAQVAAESNFNPNAKSSVGAFGLTQFMPSTAKAYGVKAGNSKEAVDSQLNGQAKYMQYLMKKYHGQPNTLELSLMAYNWGEGNVDSYVKSGHGIKTKGNPTGTVPKETRDYVTKIMGNAYQYKNDLGVSSGSSSGTSSTDKKSNSASKNADFDLDVICAFGVKNAKSTSSGKCAEYVRKALQKGDNKKIIKGGLGNAKDWVNSLPKIGWVAVGSVQTFKKGDIAVFPVSGSKFGHVCMYSGSVWFSDFIQQSVQPTSKANYNYTVFRAKSGYSNGSAVGAAAGDGSSTDGISAGGEGADPDTSTVGGLLEYTGNVLATGVADIFNSDAMNSVRDFVKGDIYKTGDTTPKPKAAGNFSKDTDELKADLKLHSSGTNGDADDLTGALGDINDTDFKRQTHHADYETVKGIVQGSGDIQRQLHADDYETVKGIVQGSNVIQRQGSTKNSLFKGGFLGDLLSRLGLNFNTDDLLSMGVKILTDKLNNSVNKDNGVFGYGINGGTFNLNDSTPGIISSPTSSVSKSQYGELLGGTLNSNIHKDVLEDGSLIKELYTPKSSSDSTNTSFDNKYTSSVNKDGNTVHSWLDGEGNRRTVITNPSGELVNVTKEKVIASDNQLSQNNISNIEPYQTFQGNTINTLGANIPDIAPYITGIGDGIANNGIDLVGGILRQGSIGSGFNIPNSKSDIINFGANTLGQISNQIKSNPLASKTGWGGIVNKTITGADSILNGSGLSSVLTGQTNPVDFIVNKAITGANKIFNPSIDYDYTDKINDHKEMEAAKTTKESNELRKYENMVQVPTPIVTPTNNGTGGGNTSMDGLNDPLVVKNPDTIIHSLAVAMLRNSL